MDGEKDLTTTAVEVLVRFKTRYEQYRVTEESIAIPTRLKRFGLSDIVNHLLQLPKAIPFDFVLNGQLLRGSLGRSIAAQRLNTESVMELEYMPAMLTPEVETDFQAPDWIGALDSGIEGIVFAGSYDGSITVVSTAGKTLGTAKAHDRAIKGISVAKQQDSEGGIVATGSQDHSVRLWLTSSLSKRAASVSIDAFAVGRGHDAEVTDVAIGPTRDVVASCSWDRSVRLWKIPAVDAAGGDGGALKKRKGQRGSSSAEQKSMETVHTMDACHTDAVTCVAWASTRSFYSGSLDRRIHSWDVETGQLNTSFHSSHGVSSLGYSPKNSLLASAHPDQCVRLWDPRMKSESSIVKSFKGHKKFVSDLCWAPYSDNLLASVSHDKTIKVWDTRADMALHTIDKAHDDKVLAVDWQMKSQIVSGGADKKIVISKTSEK